MVLYAREYLEVPHPLYLQLPDFNEVYCEYCTELMKHCDPNWKITCIETAHHILCTRPYFNNLRKDTFHVYQLKTEKNHKIAKHIKGTTDRITKFFEKT